jgi:ABC-type metal ion transport system substrate-binding protein
MFPKHDRVLPRCLQDVQAATVRFNIATQVQLTTTEHGYSGDTIRQDDTTALAMFSAGER